MISIPRLVYRSEKLSVYFLKIFWSGLVLIELNDKSINLFRTQKYIEIPTKSFEKFVWFKM